MTRKPIAAVLAAALAAGTRSNALPQEPAPSPSPQASASPSTPLKPTIRLTTAEAEKLVRDVSVAVEEIRGLKFKTPVAMEVIDGATARANFKAKIEPWEEDDARHTSAAYAQLGLIQRSEDLVTNYLNLAETGVAGYYEFGSNKFFLLNHISPESAGGVVAHELTHALEDQHYDFASVSKKANGEGDYATAISAVIEGSALAVEIAYLSRTLEPAKVKERVERSEAARAKRLRRAASYMQRSLILPYTLGFSFLLRGKVWEWVFTGMYLKDIDAAYKTPPVSTRQIFHPEQYWSGRKPTPAERPQLPDFSKLLGPGWTKATESAIGELGLSVLTGSKLDIESIDVFLPWRWTNDAASGISADLMQHYVNGEQRVTLLVTRWETIDDAREFADTLVTRGHQLFRLGVNVLVVAGDARDKAEPLAIAAMEKASYWASH